MKVYKTVPLRQLSRVSRMLLLTILFASGVSVMVAPARAVTLLSDDFQADSPGDVLDSATVPIDNWTRMTGTAAANVVTIVQDAGDTVNPTNVMEANPTGGDFIFTQNKNGFSKSANLTLSIETRLLSDGTGVVNLNIGDDELGGANNVPVDRYAITIAEAAGDDTVRLTKADSGTTTDLTSATVPYAGFSALDWHNYELAVTFGDTNDTLSVLVDGTPLFSDVLNSALNFDPIMYAYLGNGGGRQVRFDNFSLSTQIPPVPEPSSMCLLLLGLVGLRWRSVGLKSD